MCVIFHAKSKSEIRFFFRSYCRNVAYHNHPNLTLRLYNSKTRGDRKMDFRLIQRRKRHK